MVPCIGICKVKTQPILVKNKFYVFCVIPPHIIFLVEILEKSESILYHYTNFQA